MTDMDCIRIPAAALNSPEYEALTVAEKYFLIELYRLFYDTERFTIDMCKPRDYRQPEGTRLQRKVRSLLDSGLVRVVGYQGRRDHERRVFSFKYGAIEYREAA